MSRDRIEATGGACVEVLEELARSRASVIERIVELADLETIKENVALRHLLTRLVTESKAAARVEVLGEVQAKTSALLALVES